MKAARVDANQAEIVKALRAIGASVQPLNQITGGPPDLLVGYFGKNLLLEVKDGDKPPSARTLTPDQIKWHAGWNGQVIVVTSVEEAVLAVFKSRKETA